MLSRFPSHTPSDFVPIRCDCHAHLINRPDANCARLRAPAEEHVGCSGKYAFVDQTNELWTRQADIRCQGLGLGLEW